MEAKKKNTSLVVICAALLIMMGPLGLVILIPALVIYALVKNSTKAEKGPRERYMEAHPQPKFDFDKAEEERDIFSGSEGGDHRDNPFQAVREKMNTRFGKKPQPHEFGSHVHVVNDDHSRAKRLEQLEVLKGAGLYTDKEYRDRKAQIIRETE